jgi:6-pyruvoyltetrahydropterin/6-carboxytetrahydropterin synthase
MTKNKFQSTKLFDNFSVALRQHKASHSHCQLLHGYALEFKIWFESVEEVEENQLDEMNWIVDFGLFSRNGLKEWLNHMFDHTVIVEKTDPQLETFWVLQDLNMAKITVVSRIGAESLAKIVFDHFNDVFSKTEGGRIRISKVECFENKKNSAIYKRC